jgi:2-iminobutanoate/2-iminopropanoate deaminase
MALAQVIETDSVYKTQAFGFSQAVCHNGLVFTSGQVGWDKAYKLVGAQSFESQAIKAFQNLACILKEANSSIEKSLHLKIFVTRLTDTNKKVLTILLKKYFPHAYQPTTTLLCVKALAKKELLIEVEAISSIINHVNNQ